MIEKIIGLFIGKLVDKMVDLVEKKLTLALQISQMSLEAQELEKEVQNARTDEERSAVLRKIANLHRVR
jgi:hypothetical protein